MAGNSVIGALRVDLGLNTAQFTAGIKEAQGALATFGKSAAIGLAAVATAATVAAGALGVAVKASIDHADQMGKMAQKAGIGVEALSRLAYAASFSDVSAEDLTASLGKLSKSMTDAAQTPTSLAAKAFSALGISIKDASGKLKSGDEVFTELADRFSRLPDSATKTSIAMALLGKSGAQMIPLLNGGAKAMRDLGIESDKTGNTISQNTAEAANEFNDNMGRVGKSLEGLVNKALPAILPYLDAFSESLAKTDPTTIAVAAGITGMAAAATLAVPAVGSLTGAVTKLYGALALIAALPAGVLALAGGAYLASTTPAGAGEDALVKKLGLTKIPNGAAFGAGGWGSQGLATTSITVAGGNKSATPGIDLSKFTQSTAALKDWNDAIDGTITRNQELAKSIGDTLTGAVQDFVGAIMHGTSPLQAFGQELANLGQQLLNNGIQSLISSIFTPNYIGGTLGASALKLGFQTGIPGFASGVTSAPRGMAWVGENGPEIVNFRGGESVTNAATSAALAGGDHLSVSVITEVRNGNLVPVMTQVAGQVAGRTVQQQAPAAVKAAQINRIIK